MNFKPTIVSVLFLCLALVPLAATAQNLERQLQQRPLNELAAAARQQGDPVRGAILFHQPSMACAKCHPVAGAVSGPLSTSLGPDLTALGDQVTDESLIESVLFPSRVIREGYDSVTILTVEGKLISGLPIEQTPTQMTLRDVARDGESLTLSLDEIEQIKRNELSIMPAGQINQLTQPQQFYDLIRYLMEIRDGGPERARQLQPSSALLVFSLPEYENRIDHSGLIASWNSDSPAALDSLKRGEAIYQRTCANCHGTLDQPGSLPTSLRFQEGTFKNGSDPLSMYRTLTHGFGQMTPQSWMVPRQKYDVIHYIRQTYLEPHNPSQYFPVDLSYLQGLPAGDTFGPEPSQIEEWSAMNYGPSLTHTYEIPGPAHNFAYKGIATRLDAGAGGISRGSHWLVFDTDTLRVAAAWQLRGDGSPGNRFIDWRAIQFNGQHGVHPRIVGQVDFANPTGPGWADPRSGSFQDDQRTSGRDGRQYGPLPRPWGIFRGLYHYDQQIILDYQVGQTEVLEMPRLLQRDAEPAVVLRTFNLGPRTEDLILQVAQYPDREAVLTPLRDNLPLNPAAVVVAPPGFGSADPAEPLQFDGQTFIELGDGEGFDWTGKDFSLTARIKTGQDGTIFSLTDGGPSWIPDGQTFFLRGGRLVFDIGWVGAVTGKTPINDDQWHQVAVTWEQASQQIRLYVDGRLDGAGKLAARQGIADRVARIGFTSPNFPQPASFFQGEIAEVQFYQQCLSDLSPAGLQQVQPNRLARGVWKLTDQLGAQVVDQSGHFAAGLVRRGMAAIRPATGPLVAGYAPQDLPFKWQLEEGNLRLRIPAGPEPLRFSLWIPVPPQSGERIADRARELSSLEVPPLRDAALELSPLLQGGAPRWPEVITTSMQQGTSGGSFEVDILNAPESNPWLALTRFTGLDFFSDGRIAVCSWDGDVWLVTPRQQDQQTLLDWRRIASGMFQPLGLKIIDQKIHLICRDQLTVLHDLNGNGEIDYYQCLNNDHQVTEHFHEFAMGLQTDAEGNFYYAKSGCHGKAAVVPHHGTLLKVTRDGSRTEILANGFRAANGVCLNPDGSFVVTDQEGYWNPKNRINWVTLDPSGQPKFYGNILGYHDIEDSSDEAMEPPLCWITNDFDRSPAELLWVDSPRWGALNGALLNLSYGYGKVFLVPHEQVAGLMQGGMIELPLPTFPTGIMRGRFHPEDGQLYVCGMFAWAGNATHPGGLYRIRHTGQPLRLPLALKACNWGVELTFSDPLDPASIADPENYSVQAWDLKRTARYGSDHLNQRAWPVQSAHLSADGCTLRLVIPEIAPTWGMEIGYRLLGADGMPVEGIIHNTIHHLNQSPPQADPSSSSQTSSQTSSQSNSQINSQINPQSNSGSNPGSTPRRKPQR